MFWGASASIGPSSSSVVRSHEAAVALAVEVGDEVGALLLALVVPRVEQAVEVAGALVGQAVEVHLRLLVEDVEVADGAQHTAGAAEPLEHRPQHVRVEVVGEHAQRHAHAARGDAHVVQLLRVLPQPRALLVLEHLGEVEAERLDGRLGHRVRRSDVGPLLRRSRGSGPARAGPRVDGLVVVDARAFDPVAREPVAHAPVGEAGHAAGRDLREAAVEREQRLGAARAGALARGLRLVDLALGGGHEDAVVLVAGELEGARELGAPLGDEPPLVAQLGREGGDVGVAAAAARLHLGLEPAAVAVRRRGGHAVEAELGDLAPPSAHHPRHPYLREREHRLERLTAGELLDPLRGARRPATRRWGRRRPRAPRSPRAAARRPTARPAA